MSAIHAVLSQLRQLTRPDVAQHVRFSAVQTHGDGDGAEKTILNLSDTSGTLAAIATRANGTGGHQLITVKIEIDGGGEQTLTSADTLWTDAPNASETLHIIPVGARFKSSCTVKITGNGGSGNAYSGCLYLEDQ